MFEVHERTIRRLATIAVVLAGLVGCGASDRPAKPAAMPSGPGACAANTFYSCSTRNGCSGTQICMADGFLGPCVCDTDDVPGGGGTGAGGKGGAGGKDGGGPGDPDAGMSDPAGPGSGGAPAPDAGTVVPTGLEACDNGTDDDGDGDVDCADNDCAARVCLPAAPKGWSGPSVLRVGTSVPDDCEAAYATEVARGGASLTVPAAQCSTCACTPATPGCATYLDFVTSVATDCGGSTCSVPVTACTSLTSSCWVGQTSGRLKVGLPASAPSCSPAAQSPAIAKATWALSVLACAATDTLVPGGCPSKELCAPAQPAGTELCIVKEADEPCPTGPYSERRTYYSGVEDTRACSACGCAHDCSYGFNLYNAADNACAVPLLGVGLNSCVDVTLSSEAIRVGLNITGSGACTASGGVATGSATPKAPLTACCVP